MFRLCSASLRGIPAMSEGCQAKMSQFSRKNSRSAASTVGFNCAPMDAVFVGSVGWTWNLTISSAGLKEVLGSFVEYHVVPVHCGAQRRQFFGREGFG